jgi:hypothetical protein
LIFGISTHALQRVYECIEIRSKDQCPATNFAGGQTSFANKAVDGGPAYPQHFSGFNYGECLWLGHFEFP